MGGSLVKFVRGICFKESRTGDEHVLNGEQRRKEVDVPRVIRQNWKESEKDWHPRPDAYSLHLTEEDRFAFVQEHWGEQLPDLLPRYLHPYGMPFEVKIDKGLYLKIKTSRNGIRFDGVPTEETRERRLEERRKFT